MLIAIFRSARTYTEKESSDERLYPLISVYLYVHYLKPNITIESSKCSRYWTQYTWFTSVV